MFMRFIFTVLLASSFFYFDYINLAFFIVSIGVIGEVTYISQAASEILDIQKHSQGK